MQVIAVFAAVLAVANAASITESHRLGGSFSYSTSEGGAVGVVSPLVQNVVSPVASTYTVSGVPVSSLGYSGVPVSSLGYSGVPVSSLGYSGVPVSSLGYSGLGNVAVLRTSDLSGVQNVQYVPATSVVQAGTPANTYKTIAGVSPLSSQVVVV